MLDWRCKMDEDSSQELTLKAWWAKNLKYFFWSQIQRNKTNNSCNDLLNKVNWYLLKIAKTSSANIII